MTCDNDLSHPAFIHYNYRMLWPFTCSLQPLPVPLLNNETFHTQPSSTTTTERWDLSHPFSIYYHYRMLWPFTSNLHPLPLPNGVTFHIYPSSTTTAERCDLSHPFSIQYHYRLLWPFTSSLHSLPLPNVPTFQVQLASTTTAECCDLSHPSSIHYHYQMLWPFTSILHPVPLPNVVTFTCSLHPLPLPNVVTFHIHPPSTTTTECSDLSRAACIHADPPVRLGSSGTCRCRRAVWSCYWSSLLLCGWGGRQSQTLSSLYSGGCRSLDARHILTPALEMACLVLFELFVRNLLLFQHQRKTAR